ncbi:hypothetical protein BU24DRAFT_250716 [Aaosphaeria arxii CBS 175.79]|uniref:Uncharacterized protein n=1 Tax=Aaosphaeria arxii CBS 175.79 TaxID=1450172 RepID=A0A6A5XL38_9PLEO|nr:uncharacterized protein BU24DRAFT_250716 [Aaosphaeria arxii CBS 175.79]KAF2014008.1 hypothetical protein BU24DRAFT_250716 [Aaosphaeria arxii CBS 175.79]
MASRQLKNRMDINSPVSRRSCKQKSGKHSFSSNARASDVQPDATVFAYEHFPALLEERRRSRPFPPMKISFSELCTEIRVQIYRYHFRFSDPIEFWPETGVCDGDHRFDRYREAKLTREKFSKLTSSGDLNLKFLRVNRLINAEASQVFFGENEFRFSAINGQMAANIWMRRIYQRHYRWLKSITIAVPFYSDSFRSPYNATSIRTRDDMYDVMMFRSSRCPKSCHSSPKQVFTDREFKYTEAFVSLTAELMRATNLRTITLVIPHDYRYKQTDRHEDGYFDSETHDGQRQIWRDLQKLFLANPNLSLKMVCLRDGDGESNIWDYNFCDRKLVEQLSSLAPTTMWSAKNDSEGKWSVDKSIGLDDIGKPDKPDNRRWW